MGTLLLSNIHTLATMDGREIERASVFVRDGWIEQVGRSDEIPGEADQVVDLSDHIVLPGLVNTHHHLYQTLTRAVPGAQNAGLFDWLTTLYPIWARMTPDHVRVSTRLGLVELALSGCTTAFDHHYLWPNGSSLDDQIEGAAGLNMRFHVSRGSMSLGESNGGLPPDSVVEDEATILELSQRAVEDHHDPFPGGLRRVVLAPCSPFSVTGDLMRESADLARALGVRLHTHLAETDDEERFCIDRFGVRPVEYMESLGWSGDDVWYAHAVHVTDDEVLRMADEGTGVAHCPTSNMRLASGVAPVSRYIDAGVPVGLGVDGPASNDSSNMLAEARQALLLNRLAVSPGIGEGPLITARQVLEMATRGGAGVLGRDDVGRIAPGYAADMIAIDLRRVEFAGALHDPVAAAVLCGPSGVDHSWVGGRPLVVGRTVPGVDIGSLIDEHNRLSQALIG
ncbi:MAG: 8-oxoguanine deaminase [Acidimicrobiia bacterium]